MTWFANIGLIILTSYISFTNGLSERLENWLEPPVAEPSTVAQTEAVPTFDFEKLAASFEVPNVLLTNARFQSAAALGSRASTPSPHAPEDAMVNIYCTYTTDEYIKANTGSGFFITPSGAVLTNAHVAQFLLLENADRPGTTECVLRTGDPATTTFKAELLYVPPAWVQANAKMIDAEVPMGTGERDYALLYAAATVDGSPLPSFLPYIDIRTEEFTHDNINDQIVSYGYPSTMAEEGINAALKLVHDASTVTNFYTFTGPTADILTTVSEQVAHAGSSGGMIVDKSNRVIGVIVAQEESERENMRAITIPYINRTIKEETGFGLLDYVRGDLALRANTFNGALAPFLTRLLEFELANEGSE